jgi:hypothetical protein
MAAGDVYRTKAAELYAKALLENDAALRSELEGLARAYIKLAEQAAKNERLDLSYETPPKSE